jgi:hypothetical protein
MALVGLAYLKQGLLQWWRKKVEEMREVVVSTVQKVADEAAGAVKAIGEGGRKE